METGRPSDYTVDLADIICSRLANGESMRSISLDDEMPSRQTMFRWIREKEGFRDQYTRAKEESADAYAEEIADIADNGTNDWMETADPDNPGYRLNGEHVQRSKLRIDSRKWLASKLKPKKYGEKLSVGGDSENPLQMLVKEISGNTLEPEDD